MKNYLRTTLFAMAASVLLGGAALAGPQGACCAKNSEVGNRAFFAGNRCMVASAKSACNALAKKSSGTCGDSAAEACSAKASACGASTACEAKETGNRAFFSASNCSSVAKVAKSGCCAGKAK